MKVSHLSIANFRGIRSASLLFPDHALLIGDNNTGKSTILEALDLVLGPDRLGRRPPIDEHDFHLGDYLPTKYTAEPAEGGPPAAAAGDGGAAEPAASPQIVIVATVTNLSQEQRARFGDHYLEWWSEKKQGLFAEAEPAGIDASDITSALRITFVGQYDPDEDDFIGETYFPRSLTEAAKPETFTKKNKQLCGFLYLRSLRTGSRALSLEHGSLLDIILRLKEIRPQMWEGTLSNLSGFTVASDPNLGISGVLKSIDASLKKYVPREWGVEPHLKVSALTREHLRKVITAFIATGEGSHAAPFFRQGTGTVNMLVLAMLSQIAEGKQNVIFAMEEPETAIPPYAQKRIVHEIRKLSSQAIFTSHSPYVLEEFSLEETVMLSRDKTGSLIQSGIVLPASVKHKRYLQEFRTRFCEGLLASRVLIAEGATEATAFPTAARRLSELNPAKYSSLESLGITTIDAGTESQVADLGGFYKSLGKRTFGLCDKQTPASKANIELNVERLYMHDEKGFENLVLKHSEHAALVRFANSLTWPPHLATKYAAPTNSVTAALTDYFAWAKGNWGIADFLAQCNEAEIPQWIRDAIVDLKQLCDPPAPSPNTGSGAPPPAPGNAPGG